MKERSNGSTAGYYQLPAGATQLQDLISQRDMNAQIGEIFRACYRYGLVEHSDMLRDARKILFYAKAEVDRLEKLRAEYQVSAAEEPCEPAPPADYPKLAVGQVWKSRGGFRITVEKNPDYPKYSDYPFKAADRGLTYLSDGRWSYRGEDENDLVELVQDEDGWYQWKATKDSVCPVECARFVKVRWSDGSEETWQNFKGIYWNTSCPEGVSIVAYKVVQ